MRKLYAVQNSRYWRLDAGMQPSKETRRGLRVGDDHAGEAERRSQNPGDRRGNRFLGFVDMTDRRNPGAASRHQAVGWSACSRRRNLAVANAPEPSTGPASGLTQRKAKESPRREA